MENQKGTSPKLKQNLQTGELDNASSKGRDEEGKDQGSSVYQELYGRPDQKTRKGKDKSDCAGEFGSAAIPPGPESTSGEQKPAHARKEK